MLLISGTNTLLFRAGTELEEIGFVFEDVTLQDVPEYCLTGTISCFTLAQPAGLSVLVVE